LFKVIRGQVAPNSLASVRMLKLVKTEFKRKLIAETSQMRHYCARKLNHALKPSGAMYWMARPYGTSHKPLLWRSSCQSLLARIHKCWRNR